MTEYYAKYGLKWFVKIIYYLLTFSWRTSFSKCCFVKCWLQFIILLIHFIILFIKLSFILSVLNDSVLNECSTPTQCLKKCGFSAIMGLYILFKPTQNKRKKKKFYQQLLQIKLSFKSSYSITLLNWCFPPLTISKVVFHIYSVS
jgi:hypothetical protein